MPVVILSPSMETPVVQISREGRAIMLIVNGRLALEMPDWKSADAVSLALLADEALIIIKLSLFGKEVLVRHDGSAVILSVNGALALKMPNMRAAKAICDGIRAKAREAEEWEKADQVARDDAILLRAGIPLSLAHSSDVREEAEKLAVNDKDLRRYLPGGVKSQVHVGAPTVFKHPPPRRRG